MPRWNTMKVAEPGIFRRTSSEDLGAGAAVRSTQLQLRAIAMRPYRAELELCAPVARIGSPAPFCGRAPRGLRQSGVVPLSIGPGVGHSAQDRDSGRRAEAGGAGLEHGHGGRRVADVASRLRSEEHTSELQSLTNLVCRLLLEKK